ncbi:HAD family hydrolase [Singulisphaera sp. PoT]|uniref:HAD family hydrolase n=1 Tax=Singulisphaera sp. PoT TaxID=3411797 RepID=UPI003BF4B2E5
MTQQSLALIFDFGNVVAYFDYKKACEQLGRELGKTGEAFLEDIQAKGFSDLVKQYESGKIGSEDFSRETCNLAGLEVGHDIFATAWADIFWLNESVGRLIPYLKQQGYRLVLGSNTNDLHALQFRRQFAETLSSFDALVLSYEIGHLKPTAAFYEACVAAAGYPNESCVFIDDLEENVEGARAAGLQGIVYRDYPALVEGLLSLGVSIPPQAH